MGDRESHVPSESDLLEELERLKREVAELREKAELVAKRVRIDPKVRERRLVEEIESLKRELSQLSSRREDLLKEIDRVQRRKLELAERLLWI